MVQFYKCIVNLPEIVKFTSDAEMAALVFTFPYYIAVLNAGRCSNWNVSFFR